MTKKEIRCPKCGKLLAIETDSELEILCTHRGKNTNCQKCGEINKIPIKK